MRMSEKQAKSLGIKVPNTKRTKYNAKKTKIDGITFDSKAEANFYCQLKLLLKSGKISGFCRQARFVVIAGDDESRATEYVTDFVIFYPDKTYRIVDVKGVQTQEFKLKMKAMHEKYPDLKVELEGA